MELPKVEWRAAGEGEMAGDQSLMAYYYERGGVWEWQVSIEYGRQVARGDEPTASLAKKSAEFWYDAAGKARQWDAQQATKEAP